MTTSLLATEANQSTGQNESKDQGALASTDTQAQPEQKQQTEESKADTPQDAAKPEAAEAKGEKNAPKPEGAPEQYVEFDVPKGLPDGHELDSEVVGSFSKIARELDLTQAKAQKLVDGVLPVIHRRAIEQQNALVAKWNEAVKTDKEIGGQKLDENLALAKRGAQAFGDEELQGLLNGPFGAHPAVVRFLVKVGRKVSPDKFIASTRDGSPVDLNDDEAAAERLYKS